MNILRLQRLQPRTTDYSANAWSITSSSSQCCNDNDG
jgi:hypothetical protein